MSSQIKTVIIDSSVVVKWFLPDEETIEALNIENAFRNKEILIAVPILFFYELGNILKTTTKSLRLKEARAQSVFQNLLNIDFIAYSSRELFTNTLEKSIDLDISFYDASYLALAEYLNVTFITSDQKLIDKAKTNLIQSLKSFGGSEN